MKNADVRSYIGQLALVADRGYTMQRKPDDNAPQTEKDEYKKSIDAGMVFRYSNPTTKRSLQRRAARLARRYKRSGVHSIKM
jgi:hypothetical protein